MAKLGTFCGSKKGWVAFSKLSSLTRLLRSGSLGFSFATLARLCLALKVGKKRKIKQCKILYQLIQKNMMI
ncbi:hypothetical protein DMN64_04255 [Campylobacter upsaliensis]|nr:hypothetical protein [Campylobacter upsaliensis]EAL4153146.1 hypothetical protein [Campylobacter upsaliensis]